MYAGCPFSFSVPELDFFASGFWRWSNPQSEARRVRNYRAKKVDLRSEKL